MNNYFETTEPGSHTEDDESELADRWQAEQAVAAFDTHNAEIEAAGGVCSDGACYHNQPATEVF